MVFKKINFYFANIPMLNSSISVVAHHTLTDYELHKPVFTLTEDSFTQISAFYVRMIF